MGDASLTLLRANNDFRWYWFGQSVSTIGSQVNAFALPLVTAVTLDAGPGEVGFVATAAMLPYLLFSLVVGHWLEGRDLRRLMIPADILQAVTLTVVPLAWWGGWLSVPLLATVAFVAGCGALVFGLSGFAYIPAMVSRNDLTAANRAIQGSRTIAQIGGPGVAGWLVGVLGAPIAILVDALTYLISAVGVAKGHPRKDYVSREEHSAEEGQPRLRTGLLILMQNQYLRALTIHAAGYNLASQVFTLNLILWAVNTREVPEAAYGLALGAGGIGALIGTMAALKLADRLGFGAAFAASLTLSCFVPVLTTVWNLRGTALAGAIGVIMLVSGIGLGNANVYSVTLRQTIIPDDQLARSAGAYTQVMYGSIPIGSALAGILGEVLGTQTAAAIGTAGLALSALPMMTRPIRQLRNPQRSRPQGVSA